MVGDLIVFNRVCKYCSLGSYLKKSKPDSAPVTEEWDMLFIEEYWN